MQIQTLDELRSVDDRSRRMLPGGLGLSELMSDEDAAAVHQDRIAAHDLVASVPEATTAAFDRVRLTFGYGVLEYELVSVAEVLVRLTLELALRERFVAFTGGSLRFEHASESPVVLRIESYDDVVRAVGRRGTYRTKGWRIEQSGIEPKFQGSLGELRQWARAKGLLRGQLNRVREDAMFEMRNLVAHPSGHWTTYPAAVASTIQHTAELINQLWGSPTQGGRFYPAPLRQSPWVFGWTDHRWTSVPAAAFLQDNSRFRGHTCAVFMVCDDEPETGYCHSWFDLTTLPSQYLHGPASADATREWLTGVGVGEFWVDPLERTFVIEADGVGWPLRLETLALSHRGLSESIFHVITADSPGAARALAYELDAPKPVAEEGSSADVAKIDGPGRRAMHVRSGSWDAVAGLLDGVGAADPIESFATGPFFEQ